MDFSSVTWWGYGLIALAGLGFGLLQNRLMRRASLGDRPRRWLFPVKLGLWAGALIVLALVSLPLLVVFVAVSTLTLIGGLIPLYREARKEAR
ncbi:MAG: hypothetical protein GX418_02325 [Clostridiales bacterium]|nr:hypothetical protein [Clostridiales bacterium]